MQKAPEYHAFAADFCLNIFVFYTIERAGGAKRVFHRAAGAVSHGGFAAVFYCEAKSAPRGGCFCFTAISGDFVAGLYRAFGAVMSALRAGYIFVPSGQKFRCVRRAHTF